MNATFATYAYKFDEMVGLSRVTVQNGRTDVSDDSRAIMVLSRIR